MLLKNGVFCWLFSKYFDHKDIGFDMKLEF
jgi:hypothetical protein